jgi:O-antigen ligase
MKKEGATINPDYFLFGMYLIFFVSVVFSFRAISSISLGLVVLTGLVVNRKNLPVKKSFSLFIISCLLLFLLQCFSLLYTTNISEGMKLAQRSSALIFIPAAVLASQKFFTSQLSKKLMLYFAIILAIAGLYCLAVASFKYFSGESVLVFFYHPLVEPLSQHAIQLSILVFVALLSLLENFKKNEESSINSTRLLIIFLSLFLVLLSSKLIISFYIIYLFHYFFYRRLFKNRDIIIVSAFMAAATFLVITPNPISNRFQAIFRGNSELFTQKKFDPGIYFNGLQFRLLQWRFTYEILNEQHAWLSGLTPGDAQSYLDKKYVETHMYTGIAGTDQMGFLGYHTHNQFLQVTLENGLPALFIFLSLCYTLSRMAVGSKKNEVKWLVALLLIYCFTDAPLETQYGLIIFLLCPVFLFRLGGEQISHNSLSKKTHQSKPIEILQA